MRYAVTEAKAQLTDLVRRVEAGEDVVLTRHGKEVARLVPVKAKSSPAKRAEAIAGIQAKVAAKIAAGQASRGPGAVRSQDFLYDDKGLPK